MTGNNIHSFKANAHLLKLLGDELITIVDVILDIDSSEPKITVSDNGSGMDTVSS